MLVFDVHEGTEGEGGVWARSRSMVLSVHADSVWELPMRICEALRGEYAIAVREGIEPYSNLKRAGAVDVTDDEDGLVFPLRLNPGMVALLGSVVGCLVKAPYVPPASADGTNESLVGVR